MFTLNRLLGASLALASTALASAAFAAASIVPIEVPNAMSTNVADLDKKGDVVGTASFSSEGLKGFIRHKDGSFTYTVGGALISAVSANGRTSGTFETGTGSQGFIGDLDGNAAPFNVKGLGFADARSVNSSGEAVGWGEKDSTSPFRAFFLNANGKAKAFDAPGVGTALNQGTEALTIAENGLSCGAAIDSNNVRHGFLRDPAGNFTIFDPPGSMRTTAIALRKDGTVAGTYRDANTVFHAYIRAPDGTYTFYDAPGAGTASGQGTTLLAINKKGVTVGASIDSNGVDHAYMRTANGKFTLFDAPGAGTMPNTGTFAWHINDKNQIAGDALDNNNQTHGYIRLP